VAWTVLEALRPLDEKASHRYVSLLAAASELATLGQKTVQYIYDALQRLKDHFLEAWRLWPLVKAIRAYSAHTVRRRNDPYPVGGQNGRRQGRNTRLRGSDQGREATPFMLIYEGYATFHEHTRPCIYKELDALSGVY
jgi:hypothetical protein